MLGPRSGRSRRGFLGSAVAAVTGLAGCERSERDDHDSTAPDEREDGTNRSSSIPEHDHADLDAGGSTLSPSQLDVGYLPDDRPVISNRARRVVVPGDYDTIQAAVGDIPLFVRHQFTIELEPGTYDEDVVVPAFVHTMETTMDSERGFVNLVGNEADPASVEVGSIYVAGPTGRLPFAVLGLTLLRNNPYDDEGTALAFYGGGEHYVRNVNVGDGTEGAIDNGILAYAADVHVDLVDFGRRNVRAHGYTVKHNGRLMEQKVRETPSSGSVGGYAYDPEEGIIFFRGRSSTLSGARGMVKGDGVMNGFALDTEDRALYNVGELVENRP